MFIMDKYSYAKKAEIIKMFKRINRGKTKLNSFTNSSKFSNDSVKKVLTKSKYKKVR